MGGWKLHVWGIDPIEDEIVMRRFGRNHEKPCSDPNILTCARRRCQDANRCALTATPPREEE